MHQIDLKQIANIGNRMIQYAFAENLSRLIAPCEVVNVDLPEWALTSSPGIDRQFDAELLVTDFDERSMETLISQIRRAKAVRIRVQGFFQDVDKLPGVDYASRVVFPKSGKFEGRFSEKQLVINVRAGEILRGVDWYPVVPPGFYSDLVERTGLTPVFVGQVGPSLYADQLRNLFPQAEFISTGVPMDDFELVRSGKNICIAVSTFSWLAAWLSEAKQIFYPLLGFLHPSLTACYKIPPTNLAPYLDRRYRFFLFPLTYGLGYDRMALLQERFPRTWREIPAAQVKLVRESAPFLSNENSDIKFEPVWYAHNYLDAALEIAEGWYSSPLHHYLSIGCSRGYLPGPPVVIATSPLISDGKSATQSSISKWSIGKSPEEDAAGAIDGNIEKECGFHTDYEPNPWWICDLGGIYALELINIYNRRSISAVRDRVLPLLVELSNDGVNYNFLRLCGTREDFGDTGPALRPFQVIVPDRRTARYLRLTVTGRTTFLHLAQVQIFGEKT